MDTYSYASAAVVDAMAYTLLRRFLQKSDALEIRQLLDDTGVVDEQDEQGTRAIQYDVMHGLRWVEAEAGGATLTVPDTSRMAENASEHIRAGGE